MVNEFVTLSPKKQDDSNEEDSYYKPCESSDEDTSSSLLPLPDTLDAMRTELKSAINSFCGATGCDASPADFAGARPTEKEVSIARKITTANLLLDDLLNSNSILSSPIKETPLVFAAKTNPRPRGSQSSVTDPSTESTSSSSGDRCHGIAVAPFLFPNPVCEWSRCPCERQEQTEAKTEKAEPVPPAAPRIQEQKKPRKKFSLSEKMRRMRWRCRRKKKVTLVDEAQQTQAEVTRSDVSCPCPKHVALGMNFLLPDHRHQPEYGQQSNGKCACPDEPASSPEPECTCPPIRPPFRECRCEDRAPVEKEAAFKPPESVPVVPKVSAEVQADISVKASLEKSGGPREEVLQEPKPRPTSIPIPVRAQRGGKRIDVYYFDHGNSAYYRTTDSHPAMYTEHMIERTDEYATKFWAEVFGTITIALAFIISFILQLYRCLFTAIIRALTVGLIQIFSDYFFKPLLTVVFNGLIQPCLILGYNIATSTKDLCVPVCEICEFCAKDIAIIFRSCRVVEVNQKTCSSPSCQCRGSV